MHSARIATTEEIAASLVEARLSRRPLDGFPGPLPVSLEEAYRIQEAAIARWGDDIAGWKIGLVAPEMRPRLGSDRIAGPIFARDVRTARAGECVNFPVFVGGFAAVEGEFVFRIAADVAAGRSSWSDADVSDLVAAVHIGVETAGSPMRAINDLGSTVVSSDFGNNFGLILGPEVSNWQSRLDDIRVTTEIEGAVVGAGLASILPGGPVAGVRFLLSHLVARGRPLRRGQLISTGAVTGVHDIRAGQSSTITFEGCGSITCRATPAAV